MLMGRGGGEGGGGMPRHGAIFLGLLRCAPKPSPSISPSQKRLGQGQGRWVRRRTWMAGP